MNLAIAAAAPVAAATPAPTALDTQALLAAARSGQLSLQDLMDRAQALQTMAQPETAAQLYETWLAHTVSPLRHVASFNWGTLLSATGHSDKAEAAYQQGLDHLPGFAPALLNLGHLLERRGDAAGALARWAAVYDAEPAAALDLRLHALNNSARLLEVLRRYPEAEALMRRSLEAEGGAERRHPALRAHPPEAVRLAALPAGGRSHAQPAADRALRCWPQWA